LVFRNKRMKKVKYGNFPRPLSGEKPMPQSIKEDIMRVPFRLLSFPWRDNFSLRLFLVPCHLTFVAKRSRHFRFFPDPQSK
jgi:hypothetical protein